MTPSFILLIVLTAVRLWTALQLFLTARKSNQHNLYWLAGVFGQNLVQAAACVNNLARFDFDFRGLSGDPAAGDQRLMDHDAGVG